MEVKQKTALTLALIGTVGFIGYRYYVAADSKKTAEAFANKWMAVVCKRNSDHIADMYHGDGVLIGDVSEAIATGRAEIELYFREFVEKMPCGSVDNVSVIMNGDTAIANGNYTFTFDEEDGSVTNNPSRFTFILKRDEDEWKILTHHSSIHPTVEPTDEGEYEDEDLEDDYEDGQ